MAGSPFGPWQPGDPSATLTDGERALIAAGVHDTAVVYEALARRGVGPRDADNLEIWEAAVILGVHRPEASSVDGHGVPSPQSSAEQERAARAHSLLAARVAHSRGEGPPPVPRPVTPDDLAAFSGGLEGG